jgi:2,4-dienoyl-CoA reductase-like NADH-dependent reductase (Old Yellow Enzyme family)
MVTYMQYRYDIHQLKANGRQMNQMNETRATLLRNALSEPLTLGSGITLPNRLAKAATSEHLADRRGAPTNQLITA